MLIRPLLLACITASWPARASELDLLSIAARGTFSEERVLGKEQPLSFAEYGLLATVRLPWEGVSWSAWDLNARLLGSAGALRGPADTGFAAAAIPALALVHRDMRLAIELGAGLALLYRRDYPGHDYGGPLQFALTLGVSAPVYRRFGIGYRFTHYSDAGAYGSHTVGADLHMLELVYYFR